MRKIVFILLVTISSFSLYSQEEKSRMESAIVGFFNGLSLSNADTLKYHSTNDFHLLEDGAVWNMDTLVNKISGRKNSGITRVNKFEFIRIRQQGKMAWISYNNTAEFSLGEKHQTVRWLESVVLLKVDGRWKIQMMHSTRIK